MGLEGSWPEVASFSDSRLAWLGATVAKSPAICDGAAVSSGRSSDLNCEAMVSNPDSAWPCGFRPSCSGEVSEDAGDDLSGDVIGEVIGEVVVVVVVVARPSP